MLSASVLVGILVGWIRRGRLENLLRLNGRAAIILLVAVTVRLILYNSQVRHPDATVLLIAEIALYGGVFAAVAMHRRLPGVSLVGIGGALNLVAIASHGGRMPVWLAVAGRLPPAFLASLRAGTLQTHVAMLHPAGIGWLGDIISLPSPLPAEIVSVGDFILVTGIVLFLSAAMVGAAKTAGADGAGA